MADFQVTMVQAGRDLLAANRAATQPTPVSYLEIGEGTTAPALADTGVESPFAAPIRFDDPSGSAIGGSFTFLFDDDADRTYTIYEACWFSGGSATAGGGTLLYRAVIPTGLTKPLNARLHYPLAGQILGVALDTLTFNATFSVPTTPDWSESVAGKVERASPAEAALTAGQSNEKGLSVLQGWQQIGAWWAAIEGSDFGRVVLAENFNIQYGTGTADDWYVVTFPNSLLLSDFRWLEITVGFNIISNQGTFRIQVSILSSDDTIRNIRNGIDTLARIRSYGNNGIRIRGGSNEEEASRYVFDVVGIK